MVLDSWKAIRSLGFLVALTLIGCGGGGGGNPVAALEGTWAGAARLLSLGGNGTIEVDVSASGQITDIRINGISNGSTGTIAHAQGNVFSFTLDDGTEGGFMTDAARVHAGFLDEDGSFGVVQKGASGPASSYANSDVQRDWAGYTVELNSSMAITALGNSSATHTGSINFAVTDSLGSGTAFLIVLDSLHGEYGGQWSRGADSGDLQVWLSQDKAFAASWACDPGPLLGASTFPTCTFAIWNAAT